ncbi:MAG: permease [Candidatus Omnitrophica bacterium]|nr:permease [Candidatus Omnitrophota bacterium]
MLRVVVDWLVYSLLKLDPASRWAGALHFFIYDTVKIMLLLFFMIAFFGFLRSFIDQHRIKAWLVEKKIFANFFASLFGALTPFCSCSSIPIFLSFVKLGVPLGVMFSFLITSPLINEYLVVLMLGFFGWKITSIYVFSGMFIGVFVGAILGKLKLEKYLVKDLIADTAQALNIVEYRGIKQRILFGVSEAVSILRRLWFWIIVGVGVGALIHNYVPKEAIDSVLSRTGIFSVPIATILGVPMYGSCAAIVPIAVALFKKGVPLGTALAFMMATSALSLPEAIILRRAMKLQLIVIFFGITTFGIIFTGYLFNFLQTLLVQF